MTPAERVILRAWMRRVTAKGFDSTSRAQREAAEACGIEVSRLLTLIHASTAKQREEVMT